MLFPAVFFIISIMTDCELLFEKAYSIIGGLTPLDGDCGEVCGKNCCKGDGDTGMLLFPGESTDLEIKRNGPRRLAVCRGECRRDDRPLSCRIFPFFPTVENGEIRVKTDMRGAGVCPLITHSDMVVFNRRFTEAVREVGILLLTDPECALFLKEITEEINDAERLVGLFEK